MGSWQSGPVKTEWGEAILELNFPSTSDIEFKMTPKIGNDMVTRGKYRIRRGQLVSDIINKGEPVSVWLEDNELVIGEPSTPPQTCRRK